MDCSGSTRAAVWNGRKPCGHCGKASKSGIHYSTLSHLSHAHCLFTIYSPFFTSWKSYSPKLSSFYSSFQLAQQHNHPFIIIQQTISRQAEGNRFLAKQSHLIIPIIIIAKYPQSKMSSINPDAIWVLSALDKFLASSKANPALFNKLFEKKKTILQLLQNGKIDAKKYKVIVAKAFKDEGGEVKKCAEEDLLKCKDGKDEKMVQLWFKEMIENTGQPYEWQEQQYSLNTKPANTQKSVVSQQKKQSAPGLNIQILVSFKSIDSLLQQNQGKKELYLQLLQRKQKLLNLVKSQALTAEKYKATLTAYMSKISNEELISDYKFQLDGIDDFHEGNVKEWFKEIIDQTVEKLEEQNAIAKGKKSRQESVKIQEKKQAPKPQKSKPLPAETIPNSGTAVPSDLSSLCSLKAMDDILQNLTNDKVKYKQVLLRKRKILQLISQGLNAQKYKGELIKAYKSSASQSVKESIKFQLEDLTDLYENNIQEWFKQAISTAKLQLESQEEILQKLQKGEKITPIKGDDDDDQIDLSDDQDLKIDSDDDQQQKKPANLPAQTKKTEQKPNVQQKAKKDVGQSKMVAKLGLDIAKVTSLKALDQFMSENQKDSAIFCICFQRKQQIFQLMKKGEITPSKYKQLQQACLKESDNQRLKQTVEMDLFDLRDMCSNNMDEWFESLINDTGMMYEQQQEKYQKLKSSKPVQKEQSKGKKQIVKPNINEIVCFSAIYQLLDYCISTKDIAYYEDIKGKRERLIDLLSQKKLTPSKYRELNKATLSKTSNQFLKSAILEQQSLLPTKFGNKQQPWFSFLSSELTKNPPQMILPQNQQAKAINAMPADKKKLYLVQKMGAYESLLKYYNSNELSTANNKYLQEYQKVKKSQVESILTKIEKNPEIDIYNLAEQLFPQIREAIFFGEDVGLLKKKAQKVAQLLSQQIAAIKDYAGKIKKSTNAQNLEDCKKQVASCEQTIAYLKAWPEGLTAFPRVKEEKREKYNLDPVKYLDLNEIEIEITHIVGVKKGTILKIYVADFKNTRFFSDVQDGAQNGIRTIVKLPAREALMVYKGEKIICFRLFQKGFFGGLTQIGESFVQGSFIRNNINEQKVQVGCSFMNYTLRVYKPVKPLITEISCYEVTKLPKFQDDPKAKDELVKKYQNAKLI